MPLVSAVDHNQCTLNGGQVCRVGSLKHLVELSEQQFNLHVHHVHDIRHESETRCVRPCGDNPAAIQCKACVMRVDIQLSVS